MADWRGRVRRTAVNLTVGLVATVLALIALEFGSRWLWPVAPGTQFLDGDGHLIRVVDTRRRLQPNITFRQVSPDFDVLSHTGPLGLRAPEPARPPALVFVGDSFTFGQGLTDEQTIPARYCAAENLACANLGWPGTGTYRQMEYLEFRLREQGWQPGQVKLLVFAMSSSLMAGNDFVDTIVELADAGAAAAAPAPPPQAGAQGNGPLAGLVGARQWLRVNSNLVRILYVLRGPSIRARLSPAAVPQELDAGIEAMAAQFRRLQALSEELGFEYTIYVIHPVQDLLRGSHPETVEAVQRAAGAARVVGTAPALLDDPAAYYFPFDGHLNAEGARRVAAFMLEEGGSGA
jgi:hypothetical protein